MLEYRCSVLWKHHYLYVWLNTDVQSVYENIIIYTYDLTTMFRFLKKTPLSIRVTEHRCSTFLWKHHYLYVWLNIDVQYFYEIIIIHTYDLATMFSIFMKTSLSIRMTEHRCTVFLWKHHYLYVWLNTDVQSFYANIIIYRYNWTTMFSLIMETSLFSNAPLWGGELIRD